jgi:hypothetical protein
MIKTLSFLALAMTGTSALLAWIDPSPPLPTSSLSSDQLADLGQSLVADGITLREGRWDKIEILAGSPADVTGSYLTATSRSTTHFLVDLEGHPTRTPNWTRQEAAGGDQNSICIEVARRDDLGGMSRVQWEAVQGLVSALHACGTDGSGHLPVLLQGGWAIAYGLEPGTRLDLARRETTH